jgi:hypothetical protein
MSIVRTAIQRDFVLALGLKAGASGGQAPELFELTLARMQFSGTKVSD